MVLGYRMWRLSLSFPEGYRLRSLNAEFGRVMRRGGTAFVIDNERSTAINPSEGVDETVSLSDRFGLWIGFHNCSQDDYLEMVRAYADHYRLGIEDAPQPAAHHRVIIDEKKSEGARRREHTPIIGTQQPNAVGISPTA